VEAVNATAAKNNPAVRIQEAKLKIHVLTENTSCRPDIEAEHGLSLYIETQNHRILFDAGQTGLFAQNADRMGIDLSRVDICILSHGHYDHGGGIREFLARNNHAPVYMHRCAFEPHYAEADRYIGLDLSLAESGRIRFTDDSLTIDSELSLCTLNGYEEAYPASGQGLFMGEPGSLAPDDFRHEQYLIIREEGRRIAISGCSHRGILNIMHALKPDIMIGGFHFKPIPPSGNGAALLTQAAQTLLSHNTSYYTGHCTGEEQFAFLKSLMGERLRSLPAGLAFTPQPPAMDTTQE